MQNDKSISYRIGSTINYIVMAVICILMLYPFIYILALSFNDGMDAMKGGIYFFPREFTLDNYIEALKNEELVNAFTVSIARVVIATVVHLFLRATVGFALSRKQLWGRMGFTFFFYFTTLVSGGMIPTYILFRQLHLLNNFLIYIIPGIYGFFDLVMLRTYFSTILDTLEEAAYIDGSTPMQTFFRIYLPLSTPILATLALFSAVGQWNEWTTGAFYITDTKLQPAATLLQRLIKEVDLSKMSVEQIELTQARKTTPEALRNAFIIIMTAPILCVYPFLQKYFVKGVMVGSVKG